MSSAPFENELARSSRMVELFDDLVMALEPEHDIQEIKQLVKSLVELVRQIKATVALEGAIDDVARLNITSGERGSVADVQKWLNGCFVRIENQYVTIVE